MHYQRLSILIDKLESKRHFETHLVNSELTLYPNKTERWTIFCKKLKAPGSFGCRFEFHFREGISIDNKRHLSSKYERTLGNQLS